MERGADLEPHAWRCAQRRWGWHPDSPRTVSMRWPWEIVCGHWRWRIIWPRTIRDYRRQARHGRVPFAVEELLAAGLDNADLCADQPPAQLEVYLEELQARATHSYQAAALALPEACRAQPASPAGIGGAGAETFAAALPQALSPPAIAGYAAGMVDGAPRPSDDIDVAIDPSRFPAGRRAAARDARS